MSNKRIVYTASDSGIDGLQKLEIVYASFIEEERDELVQTDKNKNWLTLGEQIVNIDVTKKQALAKLDGIDKLLLGLKPLK